MTDGPTKPELDLALVHDVLEAFAESGWVELTLTVGDDRLHVSRRPFGAPREVAPTGDCAAPARSESAHSTPPPLAGTIVEAPSVGLFWRSPSPGAPPFVEVGSTVSEGDTLAIVEVMKLMNHVASPIRGTVREILVENGARVEYGQPLIAIGPDD